MKLVLRAVTALALVGVAAPAFPCGDKAETHASTTSSSTNGSKSAVAKAEKKDAKKDKASAKSATN